MIVKASDLILKIEHELEYNHKRKEMCYVRQEGLNMLAELSKTYQVALLIDYVNEESTRWVAQKLLVAEMHLQFDAIYCYGNAAKPSSFMIDVSQILLDFCLFSDFQQRYKRTQENSTLFIFVEAQTEAYDGLLRSRLAFNGS